MPSSARQIIAAGAADMYEHPNDRSRILFSVSAGDTLIVDDSQPLGVWIKCCNGSVVGWAHGARLQTPPATRSTDQAAQAVRHVPGKEKATEKRKNSPATDAPAPKAPPVNRESRKADVPVPAPVAPVPDRRQITPVTVQTPFVARAKKSTQLYSAEADTRGSSKLSRGREVAVLPGEYANGRVRVIDIATAREGWVDHRQLAHVRDIEETQAQVEQQYGAAGDAEPELRVTNGCDRMIAVYIDGDRHELERGQRRSFTLHAGPHWLYAAAEGVTPDNQKVVLKRGFVSTIRYYIRTERRKR